MDIDIQTAEVTGSGTGGGQVPAKPNALVLNVPSNLGNRTIWLWVWVAPSDTTDYGLLGSIRLLDPSGQKIGQIPSSIGLSKAAAVGASKLTASFASFVNSGGAPIADSIGLIVSNPLVNQPLNGVILQPFHCHAGCSQIVFDIERTLNITDARYWMACKSQR